jgi:hypothetical protein
MTLPKAVVEVVLVVSTGVLPVQVLNRMKMIQKDDLKVETRITRIELPNAQFVRTPILNKIFKKYLYITASLLQMVEHSTKHVIFRKSDIL